MTIPPLKQLETKDIQGLVVRGFGSFEEATFLLLSVADAARARAYLRSLCDRNRVNTAHVSPETFALQIAFTASGLSQLGVPDSAYDSFAREFLEGMNDDVRARSLGDDPSTWEWGRRDTPEVHAMLMLYAKRYMLQAPLEEELAALDGAFDVVARKETHGLANKKEHFGWTDGLSMPNFECVPKTRPRKKEQPSWTPPLRAGEFVLGYLNEYNCYSESPTAALADDPANHLPATDDGQHKNLGRNGTYLVYRELEQHVHDLWTYLAENSREPGNDKVERAVALGSKMVGRWPGGAPLMTSPDRDDSTHATDNEFTYGGDPIGLRCPVGCHIRRANPRDSLTDHDVDDSTTMVRKHQMVRRGRTFGPPVSEQLDPHEVLAKPKDDVRRGLHFICLVGNISRQFEFVQRNWIQSANFNALYKDGDPITGTRRAAPADNINDEFTCPATPLRRKYKHLPQFTTLLGGAYFFLPGMAALRFIAHHP
jgi:Dyp-type peroxidase family